MKSKIHELDKDKFNQFLAWIRYLSWCDMQLNNLNQYDERTNDGDPDKNNWFAFAAQWYASLWVVIEGWRQIQLSDSAIDNLLDKSPKFCDLLRRFRNGVYHFQPDLLEPRLLNFLSKSNVTTTWAHLLHGEFIRFSWELIDSIHGEDNKQELRESIFGMVGWLPTTAFEERIRELQIMCAESLTILDKDTSSPAALDLFQTIQEVQEILNNNSNPHLQWRNALIEDINKNGGLE